MPPSFNLIRAVAAGLALLAVTDLAAAQDAADAHNGKTLTLIIGAAAGSDDDIYARLLARHLGKHLAGNPAIATSNMPGAGGHAAAAYIYATAGADGSVIGAVPPETLTEPLWFGLGKFGHDPRRFVYLGAADSESTDCFVNSGTPVMSLRDVLAGEVAMGALSDGGPTREGPALLNAVVGTRFRTIANYRGIADILAAVEIGDVAGACGLTFSSVSSRRPDWLPKGVLRGLVQESVSGSPLATRMGIPLVTDFVRSPADRELLALAYTQHKFGRPYILPPGTAPERTATLRRALVETLQDTDLLADARRASVQINPLPGGDVEALIHRLYAMPPELIQRVRAALAGRT